MCNSEKSTHMWCWDTKQYTLRVKLDEFVKLDGTMSPSPEASTFQGSLGYDSTLPSNRDKRDLECRTEALMKVEELWMTEEAKEASRKGGRKLFTRSTGWEPRTSIIPTPHPETDSSLCIECCTANCHAQIGLWLLGSDFGKGGGKLYALERKALVEWKLHICTASFTVQLFNFSIHTHCWPFPGIVLVEEWWNNLFSCLNVII